VKVFVVVVVCMVFCWLLSSEVRVCMLMHMLLKSRKFCWQAVHLWREVE
jgi:hypothetical protein